MTFDIAVVGGGVAGVSIAYWLKRLNPSASVAVIERFGLASGASGRNAGFLLQGGAGNFFTELAAFGEEALQNIWRLTGENLSLIASELDHAEIQLDRCGSYFCAGSNDEMDQLQSLADTLARWNIPAERLSTAALKERTGSCDFFGGLYYPDNAYVHPARLVRHIAGRSGAAVLENHEVVEVTNPGGGVKLATPRRDILARRVVFACNAYLPLLFPGLEESVRPVRAQMLATLPGTGRRLFAPLYSHDGYYYVRQQPDGRLLAGGARHLHLAAEQGFSDETTAGVQTDIEAYLRRHFPWTENLPAEYRWAGTMGFSPDGAPIFDRVPDLEDAYWIGGFSGHGMAFGFVLGKLVAERLSGGAATDLSMFSAARLFSGESMPFHAG